MPRSIASAPGKTLLFGEHAALFGVTAVAAALSDLRVVVEVVSGTHMPLVHNLEYLRYTFMHVCFVGYYF